MKGIINFSEEHDEEHWISVSDLMAGLMMVFLLIAIAFIITPKNEIPVIPEPQTIEVRIIEPEKKPIADPEELEKNKIEKAIYEKLKKEFKDDLEKWEEKPVQRDLTIRFNAPDVLFIKGKSELRDDFKEILNSFFPRYLKILYEFKDNISEIRIEGHTSSEYSNPEADDSECSNSKYNNCKDYDYIKNMRLSQDRAIEVLDYSLFLTEVANNKAWKNKANWAKGVSTANGLSSNQLIRKQNGEENKLESRRVEFKVKIESKQEILKILQRSKALK